MSMVMSMLDQLNPVLSIFSHGPADLLRRYYSPSFIQFFLSKSWLLWWQNRHRWVRMSCLVIT